MLNRTIDFLKTHIWRIDFEDMPRRQRFVLRPLRVLLLAIRGFDEDRIQLRASALTYYTLLSVVPFLAVVFGVAKGFGLEEAFERLITNVRGQQEVISRITEFANQALAEARGGVVAGVGVAFLFWSVIRLLSTVENSLNDIWGVRQGRPLGRRLVDYLAFVLITPVILTTSAAMVTRATGIESDGSLPMNVLVVITRTLGGVLPFIASSLFLGALYRFMPHARISIRAALLGGTVAGTINLLTQWGYLEFQTYMSGMNAIYGTFTALPLFLIWLQLSWLVILFGAEIAYAVDNEETYAFEREWGKASQRIQRMVALRFMESIAGRFERGEEALSAEELACELEIPARLSRRILYDLASADVVVAIQRAGEEDDRFIPARSVEGLTVKQVLDALEHSGEEPFELASKNDLRHASAILSRFDARIRSAPENVPVHRLRDVRDVPTDPTQAPERRSSR
jgi:membrane protein